MTAFRVGRMSNIFRAGSAPSLRPRREWSGFLEHPRMDLIDPESIKDRVAGAEQLNDSGPEPGDAGAELLHQAGPALQRPALRHQREWTLLFLDSLGHHGLLEARRRHAGIRSGGELQGRPDGAYAHRDVPLKMENRA